LEIQEQEAEKPTSREFGELGDVEEIGVILKQG
jgi:hypothetical protein